MLEAIYNSRKFKFGIITSLAIILTSLLVLVNPVFAQLYPTIAGSLITVYGIYCGMNVANKYTLGKAQGATVQTMASTVNKDDELPAIDFKENDNGLD